MQRNSVVSFKNKNKTACKWNCKTLLKEEKNVLPLEWRYTFIHIISKSISIDNNYILFLSFYNCWSQSTRTNTISASGLFTEVAPSIHFEKWMELDSLPQDPQIFLPGWSWITLNGIWPIWSYIPFCCIMQTKGKEVFLVTAYNFAYEYLPLIHFNKIWFTTNNFCVVDPFKS